MYKNESRPERIHFDITSNKAVLFVSQQYNSCFWQSQHHAAEEKAINLKILQRAIRYISNFISEICLLKAMIDIPLLSVKYYERKKQKANDDVNIGNQA